MRVGLTFYPTVLTPGGAVLAPREGDVTEFLFLLPDAASFAGDPCYEVTPTHIEGMLENYRIYKFADSCASYLLYDGGTYALGGRFGGFGFTDAALADLDGDGVSELYFTTSWGSGVHRAEACVFDPAAREVRTLYTQSAAAHLLLGVRRGGVDVYAAETASLESSVSFTITAQDCLGSIQYRDGALGFYPAGE